MKKVYMKPIAIKVQMDLDQMIAASVFAIEVFDEEDAGGECQRTVTPSSMRLG